MIKKTLLISGLICSANITFAATPHELLNGYEAKSAKAEPARGEKFFNAKHGKEWSCASCHESPPNHDTRHIVTGKVIKALSPNSHQARLVTLPKSKSGSSAIATMCWGVNAKHKKKRMCSLG
jgi:cytochrome c553